MPASENICLVGWGAIGQRVAALLSARGAPVRIAAIAVRDPDAPREGVPEGARLIKDPADLPQDAGITLVVEAAGRPAVGPWGRAALASGMDFAVSSTSGFVDQALLAELTGLARQAQRQILIPPGALGGIDALAAASRLPLGSVEHRIIKPAQAWKGTKAETLCDLDALTSAHAFFQGSAAQAADDFPQNANATIITSLAGVGMEKTRVTMIADPQARQNIHEIIASGDFGTLSLRLDNRPLASNPKSSEMTALNLVRLIENRVAPVVF